MEDTAIIPNATGEGEAEGEHFKYAIFAYEDAGLADNLKVVDELARAFAEQPHGADTAFHVTRTMDEAGDAIDGFKARNCGSAYSLAVLNLNNFPSAPELEFLLSGPVLGDPKTVFLASMRAIKGPAYAFARAKVDRENNRIVRESLFGAPSCVEFYAPDRIPETAVLVAEVLNAILDDKDASSRSRQTGMVLRARDSKAREAMGRSATLYAGRYPKGGFDANAAVRDSGRHDSP